MISNTAVVVQESQPTDGFTRRQWIGLLLVPPAFAWFWWGPAPAGTTSEMRSAAALTAVMALLWVCESVPLAATALLPLVFLPLFRVATPAEAAGSYAGDLIFLFIGGFILANGIEYWGLHRRVALWILSVVGTDKRRLVGGLMAATAFISLWISNTAAALLMMPVGLSVLGSATSVAQTPAAQSETQSEMRPQVSEDRKLGTTIALGISTAATIGGMGTPIGSTPNLLFVNTVQRLYNSDVSFIQWMMIGVPLVVAFTVFAWWLFTFALFPLGSSSSFSVEDGRQAVAVARRELGRMRFGEVLVGSIFVLTALGWIFREPRTIGDSTFGLSLLWPGLSDGTIAIAGALALFLVPVSLRPGRFALDWENGGKIPWDIILLFGGGLSLADGIQRSHLDTLLVQSLGDLRALPGWLVLVLVCAVCVALSEIASNTATAALLMPLMGALATALGENPLFLMLPVAFATSLGFMLPVATPPNALALATKQVTVSQMALAGLILNLAGMILVIGALYLLGFPAFGVNPGVDGLIPGNAGNSGAPLAAGR